MTDDELTVIRARAEAATPGPWEAVKLYDVTDTTYIDGCDFSFNGDINVEVERAGLEYPEWVMIGPDSPEQKQIHADAEFIAAARTDIPALLAEVERLRTENAELEAANKRMWRIHEWQDAAGIIGGKRKR